MIQSVKRLHILHFHMVLLYVLTGPSSSQMKRHPVAFILCVHEAIVHWHDERSEINIKKQDVLINKYSITYPCSLNNDKEVPFVLHYQLPLSHAPCIWDPGIDLFSYKKLHCIPWIPRSTIIVLADPSLSDPNRPVAGTPAQAPLQIGSLSVEKVKSSFFFSVFLFVLSCQRMDRMHVCADKGLLKLPVGNQHGCLWF
jgi:hypothetical protein